MDCTSCWLLSHLGLLWLERSGVRVLVFYLVLPVYHDSVFGHFSINYLLFDGDLVSYSSGHHLDDSLFMFW